jgi:hypothetical protein
MNDLRPAELFFQPAPEPFRTVQGARRAGGVSVETVSYRQLVFVVPPNVVDVQFTVVGSW